MTTNDNEWYNELQLITTSKNELQRVGTNNSEWSFRLNFAFFRIREEPIIRHTKEDPLNQRPCEVQ